MKLQALVLGLAVAPAVALALAQDRPARGGEAEGGAALVPAHPPEINEAARGAIQKGIDYLLREQNRDGSWRSGGQNGGHPTAMTALAGLALLSSGSTPTEGPYAKNVSAALSFILKSVRKDGLIAQLEEESHCMHGHGLAILYLGECYGMEEDNRRQAEIRLALQRAIELTARSQSAAGGWLYTPDSNNDEGSVTVTQVQGLRSARNAGVAVPKKVIDDAMKYLEKSANGDGGIRYQASDQGPSRPAITAAAVVCWQNAGEMDNPLARKAMRFVETMLSPSPRNDVHYMGHYYYAHLYMAQAMYLAGEEKWQKYFGVMRDALVAAQKPDGSWEGDYVGPTYGTAVALIILQLPYKNLPIMQR